MSERRSKSGGAAGWSAMQSPMAKAVRSSEKNLGFSTLAVHGGEPRPKLGNSLATPIIQTATYTFSNTRELHDHFQRRIEREEYGRYGNPTQRI
ncbi:MAG TPA: PLP-dependent transferase, partial [Phototrophicaceae bacterium]|nr:PLP-dependent transferase [Phototrophicaceae bacterium]